MKKHFAYIIVWVDSASLRGWQLTDADHTPAKITTIGWVFKETKDYIAITTSISGRGAVMDALSIPKKCIVDITKLRYRVEGD